MAATDRRHPSRLSSRFLRLEPLEARRLLAGDVLAGDLAGPDLPPGFVAETLPIASARVEAQSAAEISEEIPAEVFALMQQIQDSGAVFYGAHWCSVCQAQKQAFRTVADLLPYVESANPDGSPNDTARQAGVEIFPTWRFPRQIDVEALMQVSEEMGRPFDPARLVHRGESDDAGVDIIGLLYPAQLDVITRAESPAETTNPPTDLPDDVGRTAREEIQPAAVDAVMGMSDDQVEVSIPIASVIREASGESIDGTDWRNPFYTYDTNDSGDVTALDALVIINLLNRLDDNPSEPMEPGPPYYDVSGDGQVSAVDALQVINELNAQDGRPAAEVGVSSEAITEFKDQFIFWDESEDEDAEYLVEVSTQSDCRGGFVEDVTTNFTDIEMPTSLDVGTYYVCQRVRTPDGVVRPADNNGLEFTVVGNHVMFVTSGGFSVSSDEERSNGEFGNVDGADFNCTAIAASVDLIEDWDGETIVWKAVLSEPDNAAYDRLDIEGRVVNLGGELLALDKDDLFDNDLASPIAFDETGSSLIGQRFWHGSISTGRSRNSDCNGWHPSGGTANVGTGEATNWFTGAIGGGDCGNSNESLACISPLLPPVA